MKLRHLLLSLIIIVITTSFTPKLILADEIEQTNVAVEDIEDPYIAAEQNSVDLDEKPSVNEPVNDNQSSEVIENESQNKVDEINGEEVIVVTDEETNTDTPVDELEQQENTDNVQTEPEYETSPTVEEKQNIINSGTEINKSELQQTNHFQANQEKTSFTINDKHPSIIELKQNLTKLGFGGMNINETFGSYTAKRIRDFQKYYGLPVTGNADLKTLTKIHELINSPFHVNKKHKDVIPLKEKLVKLGFGGMNINETYGSFTAKRVTEFQAYYGLVQNGIADSRTFDKINEILSSPFQVNRKHKDVIPLKEKLTILGYGGMNINETYGSFTAKQVTKFQKEHGLKAHGIADEVTLNKLASVIDSAFQEGGRHKAVITLKNNLKTLGFGGMNINETYGSYTAKRVRDFQEYFGLPVTGKADEKTLRKISELLNSPYNVGKKHKNVIPLKEKLVKLGFSGMNINETYGSFTAKKVKELQAYYGLVQNGIADDKTIELINEILASPFQVGGKHKDVIPLKEKLIKLKFGGMNINETYGSFTAKKVREFQTYYGLIKNGIADSRTFDKINEILSSPFQVNRKHKNVIPLKEKLKKLGYGGMNINETYGSFTAKQVTKFQKDHGLKAHGIADEITFNKIEQLIKELNNKKSRKKIKIFIDPGHGGSDPGAKSGNTLERVLTLDISKRIVKYLNQYKGIEIKMSRTEHNQTVSLSQRTNMANSWGADYYVSVHINAGGGTGFESFIYNSPTQDEINKQNIIHDHIVNTIKNKDNIRDRGKKRANFHVLRESNMSAILFEYLFIDTTSDRNKLNNSSFRDKLARLTAEGIAKAFNLKKK